MPIVWRVNVLDLLKDAGYSTYRLRKENLLSQSTIQCVRHGKSIGWSELEKICAMTGKQPGKLIEYIPDPKG